jgi:HK97 family phage major capsid protein
MDSSSTTAQRIIDLRIERAKKWEEAKAFLESHRDDADLLSHEDGKIYDKMEAAVVDIGRQIERMERGREIDNAVGASTSRPLVGTPGGYNNSMRGSGEYTKAFWNALRGRSVSNVLSVGEDTSGGYLVPEEFANELVQALEEQNIFRRIARIVSTSRDKLKVPVATASGTASWIDENEVIPESDSNFSQIILNACKLGTMMRSSSELIEDSAFNIQAYIAQEFARRIGAREEEAFCVGDGTGKPTGVFTASGAPGGVTATSEIGRAHV